MLPAYGLPHVTTVILRVAAGRNNNEFLEVPLNHLTELTVGCVNTVRSFQRIMMPGAGQEVCRRHLKVYLFNMLAVCGIHVAREGGSMSQFSAQMSLKLENQFFFEKDRALLEQLARLRQERECVEALSKVSGITDEAVLKELVAHNIRPETLAALCLIPVIEVVWADGKVDAREIAAVLEAARKNGLAEDHAVLQEWLRNRPDANLHDVWKKYVRALAREIDKSVMVAMEADILAHAKAVAEASGHFLGLINPISPREREVLDGIAEFFRQING